MCGQDGPLRRAYRRRCVYAGDVALGSEIAEYRA